MLIAVVKHASNCMTATRLTQGSISYAEHELELCASGVHNNAHRV